MGPASITQTRSLVHFAVGAIVAALVMLRAGSLLADESDTLPLPEWGSTPEGYRLGGSLLPEGSAEASEGGLMAAGSRSGDPPVEIRRPLPAGNEGGFANFFKLFIPRSKTPPGSSAPEQLALSLPPEPVRMEVLQPVFEAGADVYLLDPQEMVSETQAEDLRRLLNYHANGAKIAIYILVLAPGQTLPEKVDLGKFASGALLKRLSCLAVYPMDEPWRARLFTSREIMDVASPASLAAIPPACVKYAMQASDEVEQIERFTTQLSIRLFWMERSYALGSRPAEEIAEAGIPPVAAARDPLPEVATSMTESGLLSGITERAKTMALPGLLLLGCILALAGLVHYFRRRRRRLLAKTVWLLPEAEGMHRLGGPHCGGCGAVMKYG